MVRDIAGRIAKGEQGITGIMMESFIEGGNQKAAPLDQLVYGKSITDKCLSWNTTEQLLRELAQCGGRAPLEVTDSIHYPRDCRKFGKRESQSRKTTLKTARKTGRVQ